MLFLPLKVQEEMPAAYCGTTPTIQLDFEECPYLLDD
jgi:hypothetical protein